jgi:hypothetical protein
MQWDDYSIRTPVGCLNKFTATLDPTSEKAILSLLYSLGHGGGN